MGPRIAVIGWATLVGSTAANLLLQGPYGDGTPLVAVFGPGSLATTLELPLGDAHKLTLGCVAVLAVTGPYQAWRQLGDWTAFRDTDYGRVLLAKLIAVGALLASRFCPAVRCRPCSGPLSERAELFW